jgi:multiphosphoryl transfer protein
MTGEPEAAVLLAGPGVTERSMAPSRIPAVKAALRESDMEAAAAAARRALPQGDRGGPAPESAR